MSTLFVGADIGTGAVITTPKTARGKIRATGSPAALAVFLGADHLASAEHCCPFAKEREFSLLERVMATAEWMEQWLDVTMVTCKSKISGVTRVVVGYEIPPYVNSAEVHHNLSFAAGVYAKVIQDRLMPRFPDCSVELVGVMPSQAKAALIHGHADKSEMIRAFSQQFGIPEDQVSEHRADAASVALAARVMATQIKAR
jgi:hypothetical protein